VFCTEHAAATVSFLLLQCSVAVTGVFCCCNWCVLLLFHSSRTDCSDLTCCDVRSSPRLYFGNSLLDCVTLMRFREVQIAILHALQEGYNCCGACEIDEHCKRVRLALSACTQTCCNVHAQLHAQGLEYVCAFVSWLRACSCSRICVNLLTFGIRKWLCCSLQYYSNSSAYNLILLAEQYTKNPGYCIVFGFRRLLFLQHVTAYVTASCSIDCNECRCLPSFTRGWKSAT
jgi:hypothetical protein